jgi:hypothetical protein
MQDEIIKHTKKTIGIMKSSELGPWGKVKAVVGEILIIVFAVSFSIWLHNFSEHRHEQAQVREFLSDLHADLLKDRENMGKIRSQLDVSVEGSSYLFSLSTEEYDKGKSGPDSAAFSRQLTSKIQLPLIIRKNIDGNYEGFKTSGKIALIENKPLKKSILAYYQQSLASLDEADRYYNDNLTRMGESLVALSGKSGREIVFNPQFRAHLMGVLVNGKNVQSAYDETMRESDDLIRSIDAELKH